MNITLRIPEEVIKIISRLDVKETRKEWLYFFYYYFYICSINVKPVKFEKSYSSKILRDVFSDEYIHYERILEENKLLFINRNDKGEKIFFNGDKSFCTTYKLLMTDGPSKLIEIKSANPVKRYLKFRSGIFRKTKDKSINDKTLEILNNLVIDKDIIYKLLQQSILNEKISIKTAQEVETYIEHRTFSAFRIMEKESWNTRDDNGRLYTSFTSLKRCLRNACSFGDNKQLIELDFSNFQPWIISKLADKLFCDNLNIIYYENKWNQNEDWILYCKICQEGELWNYLTKKYNKKRNWVKDCFISEMFKEINIGKSQFHEDGYQSPMYQLLLLEFPSIIKYIEVIKQNNYKLLSQICQSAESMLMIDNILYSCLEEDLRLLSVHDAVFVHEDDFDEVYNIILDIFSNLEIEMPHPKIKKLDKPKENIPIFKRECKKKKIFTEYELKRKEAEDFIQHLEFLDKNGEPFNDKK